MQPPDAPVPPEPTPNPPTPENTGQGEPPPMPSTPPPAPTTPPPAPTDGPSPSAPSPTFNFGTIPSPVFDPPANKDEKLWGLLLHLGGALGSLTASFGIPGGNVLVPLIIWLVKKDESRFLNDQGKEVLNFQICMLVLSLISIATCVLFFLIWPIAIVALVLGIVGGVKANEGVAYRYPVNFRLIK